jgi:hypothetical protein
VSAVLSILEQAVTFLHDVTYTPQICPWSYLLILQAIPTTEIRNPRTTHVGLVVDKVTLGHVSLQEPLLSLAPPMLHSLIYHH